MTASLQISSKLPDGRIFVIGGDDIDSFEQNLKAIVGDNKAQDIMGEMAASLSGAGTIVQAATNIMNAFPGATVDHTAHPVNQNTAPAGKNCIHGPMTKREGSGAKGPWKAYMCPTPKGTPDQCQPEFLKRGTNEWNAF